MIRPPPRSTRTAPLFPSTPLFRSPGQRAMRNPAHAGNQPHRESRLALLAPIGRAITMTPDAKIESLLEMQGIEHIFGRREDRSEEHTSELKSLMRISYAVFCLNKKKHTSHDKDC